MEKRQERYRIGLIVGNVEDILIIKLTYGTSG